MSAPRRRRARWGGSDRLKRSSPPSPHARDCARRHGHHRERAHLLARLGRDDEAITELDLIIDTQPNHGYALYKRAELELARGDAAAALADAENARKNGSASSETIFLLIQANLAVGNLEKALAEVAAIQGQNYPRKKTRRDVLSLRYPQSSRPEGGGRGRALRSVKGKGLEHILRIQECLRNTGFEAAQIPGAFDEITKQQLAACLLKGACSSTFQRAL